MFKYEEIKFDIKDLEKENEEALKEVSYFFIRLREVFKKDSINKWKFETLIKFFIRRENVKSSNLERINTTIEQDYIAEEKDRNNWKKDGFENIFISSRNFRKAINLFNHNVNPESLKNLKLNNLKLMHRILFEGISNKKIISGQIGEFKTTNNLIEGEDENGVRIPIFEPCSSNKEILFNELTKLEHLINLELNDILDLNKIFIYSAIIHALFERIHPFSDGNGRLGRTLIPIYFVIQKVFDFPIVFLSNYFKITSNQYYENLKNISLDKNYSKWIKYFLNGLLVVAKNYIDSNDKIDKNYNKLIEILSKKEIHISLRKNHISLSKILVSRKIFTYSSFKSEMYKFDSKNLMSQRTAKEILFKLYNLNLIEVIGKEAPLEKQRYVFFRSKYFFSEVD